jgi:hypothetical protein
MIGAATPAGSWAQASQAIGHAAGTQARQTLVAGRVMSLIMPLSWAGGVGAGDGNRTRTVSLEADQSPAVRAAELGIRVSASDRGCQPFTGVNGTLMAR